MPDTDAVRKQGNREGVLLASQYFHPDIGATGQVLTELAEDLVRYGKKVEVVTGQPGYALTNKGKVAHQETYRGIRIHRIPYIRATKDKAWGRMLRDCSFFLSLFLNLLCRALFRRRCRTWLFVSNPPIAPFVGAILKKCARARFVYLLHDLYPDLAITVGYMKERSLTAKLLRRITSRSFRAADAIVCLGRDVRNRLITKYSANPLKVKVIPNWADERKFQTASPGQGPIEKTMLRKFNLFYTGNIGLSHALEDVIEAAKMLQSRRDIQFVFIGEGGKKARLKELVKEKNIENVVFLSYQPLETYPAVLAQADALIVTLQAGMEGISVPSKTYAYMASGRPIIAMLPRESEIGRLTEREKCGLRVDPGDVNGFCSCVLELYGDEGKRHKLGMSARLTFERNYRRSLLTRKYLDVV